MKNIPRLFIDHPLSPGVSIAPTKEMAHYLTNVMRLKNGSPLLVFNDGREYNAHMDIPTTRKAPVTVTVLDQTDHADPSNDLIVAFGVIKQARLEDMIAMATQLGVRRFVPVITDHTNAGHLNWERLRKIMIEGSEQANRNTVPVLSPVIKFADWISETKQTGGRIIFADERAAHSNPLTQIQGRSSVHAKVVAIDNFSSLDGLPATCSGPANCTLNSEFCTLLIGPEGGFSDTEFAVLDKIGAVPLSLGKTILRAEVAAVAAIAKILN